MGIRALLVDLEGTVYQAGKLIPGAGQALRELGGRSLPHCFVTNTTSRPRSALVAELAAMGLDVEPRRIFTAPLAGRRYLLSRGLNRCHLLVNERVLEDFVGITPEEERPDAVVVGDVGERFTFARLNPAFRFLLEGAELVALARNRYYLGPEGLLLDVGAFVAALEYASNREAVSVGKPSLRFFRFALEELGVPPAEAAMVGDDIESDVLGAQTAGMRGILVRTGKFREEDLERSDVRPDGVVDSLSDIARVL